jgi:type II secretory ATPase GspE/PulE/Tfp pilus assembly ATPase PilB-like protein
MQELQEIGLESEPQPLTLYRGRGCSSCAHTGYRGRVGIFELMLVEDSIRAMVSKNVDAKTIKKQAVSRGMGTLRLDGTRKVLRGLTSVAELLRATEEEGTIDQI